MKNKMFYDMAGQNLYAQLIARVEDDVREHWDQDGLKRIVWGFQIFHEKSHAWSIFESEGTLWERIVKYHSKKLWRNTVYDPGMRDIFSELCGFVFNDREDAKIITQKSLQYMREIFDKMPDVDIEQRQKS